MGCVLAAVILLRQSAPTSFCVSEAVDAHRVGTELAGNGFLIATTAVAWPGLLYRAPSYTEA
jgi:hypothetical protein